MVAKFSDSSVPKSTVDGFANKEQRFDYSGTNLIYAGSAAPKSLTSEAVWHIQKFTYDGSDNLTRKQVIASYDQVWDDRASITF